MVAAVSRRLDASVERISRASVSSRAVVDDHDRVLRIQADERLVTMLRASQSSLDGGLLTVPSRESVELGARVRVELSFGPMADEIVLRGAVESSTTRGERAPQLSIRIVKAHAARVRYVHEVLSEGRQASTRASRRVPSQIQATWSWGLGSHVARLSDISKGGAFIRSITPPPTSSTVKLELDDSMAPCLALGVAGSALQLEATVAWVGRSRGQRGFGVKFRVLDRALARRIAALVAWHERQADLID